MLGAVRKQGFLSDLLIPAVVTFEAVMVLFAGVLSAHTVSVNMMAPWVRDVVVLGSLLGMVLAITSLK
ncbi:MAG: hypothetical protein ACR2RE_09405, partial [Geminicoccaceae bacterium]